MRKLRKEIERLEKYVIKKSVLDMDSFRTLFNEVADLKDRVETLENRQHKTCECKKENEDDI